jgi:2,3-bisphosphoglycerate-independent phosphoglycerate mutase
MKAEQERIRVQQQMDMDQQRLTQSFIQRESEALEAKIPELKNKDKKTQLLTDLKTYGLTQGYTDEELSSTVDHRAILVLDKARKYDEMKKQSPNIKRLKKVPKVLKPGAKQPQRSVPSQKRTKLKMKQLKQTGRIEDGASLIFDMMQSGAIK